MQYNIAIIGQVDLIKPFLAVGAKVFEVNTNEEAASALSKAEAMDNIGIIMISESFAVNLSEEIDRLKRQPLPALFIMPEYNSQIHAGKKRLQQVMARATGKIM